MPEQVSLYDCQHARCQGDRVRCARGHRLAGYGDGSIDLIRVRRGAPLRHAICQGCMDWSGYGPDVVTILPDDQKGWV